MFESLRSFWLALAAALGQLTAVYTRLGYRDIRPVRMWERRRPVSAG